MDKSHEIVSVLPEFGVNYNVGYIGFTYTDNSFISKGIAWFTRWDQGKNRGVPDVPLSHVIVVTGDGMCAEATVPKSKETPLSEYFNDPHKHVFFRKPVGWTDDLGKRISWEAICRVGFTYGYTSIVGHALANNFVGKALGFVTFGLTTKLFKRAFDKKNQFICSEYAALAMQAQPELKDKGVLAKKACEIDPQMLFQDQVIFSPWTSTVCGKRVVL